MSHVEADRGFKARAMVDPHEGTVESLTKRDAGAKRGKLVSTPVRIISEEHYQQMATVHNDLIEKARRSAEVMNELAADPGPRDRNLTAMHCESPQRDRVQEGSGLEGWNKACDETIVRHHERRKALQDFHDKEHQREHIRNRGGIHRTIIDVIETLEALTESRSHQEGALTIEQVSGHEETVIKIRIPAVAAQRRLPSDY